MRDVFSSAVSFSSKRPAGKRAEQIADLLDGAAKDRLLRQQLAPHRPPLLAHARADEHRLRRHARRAAGRAVGAAFSAEESFELLRHLGTVVGYQRQAELVMGALCSAGETDVAQAARRAALVLKRVQKRRAKSESTDVLRAESGEHPGDAVGGVGIGAARRRS